MRAAAILVLATTLAGLAAPVPSAIAGSAGKATAIAGRPGLDEDHLRSVKLSASRILYVWQQTVPIGEDDEAAIVGRIYDASTGKFGEPVRLGSRRSIGGTIVYPLLGQYDVGVASTGEIVMATNEASAGQTGPAIWVSRFSADLSKRLARVKLDADLTADLRLEAMEANRFALAWTTANGSDSAVRAAAVDGAFAKVGKTATILSGVDSPRSALARADTNKVVVAYGAADGNPSTAYVVRGKLLDTTSGRLSSTSNVLYEDLFSSDFWPVLTRLAPNGFALTMNQALDSSVSVRAKFFDGKANPTGSTVLVSPRDCGPGTIESPRNPPLAQTGPDSYAMVFDVACGSDRTLRRLVQGFTTAGPTGTPVVVETETDTTLLQVQTDGGGAMSIQRVGGRVIVAYPVTRSDDALDSDLMLKPVFP